MDSFISFFLVHDEYLSHMFFLFSFCAVRGAILYIFFLSSSFFLTYCSRRKRINANEKEKKVKKRKNRYQWRFPSASNLFFFSHFSSNKWFRCGLSRNVTSMHFVLFNFSSVLKYHKVDIWISFLSLFFSVLSTMMRMNTLYKRKKRDEKVNKLQERFSF